MTPEARTLGAPLVALPSGEMPESNTRAVVGLVPRLALTVEEACQALGVSWDTWNARIAPDVRIVRLGRRKLVPVAELERWLEREAALALDDPDTSGTRRACKSMGARQPRATERRAA